MEREERGNECGFGVYMHRRRKEEREEREEEGDGFSSCGVCVYHSVVTKRHLPR